MKDKLEEKLQYIKDAGYDLTDYETVDMLSTLIQESNKKAYNEGLKANQMVDWTPSKISRTEYEMSLKREAIRDFIKWCYKKYGAIQMQCGVDAETYLSSIGKDKR